jgi:hypothetical protein
MTDQKVTNYAMYNVEISVIELTEGYNGFDFQPRCRVNNFEFVISSCRRLTGLELRKFRPKKPICYVDFRFFWVIEDEMFLGHLNQGFLHQDTPVRLHPPMRRLYPTKSLTDKALTKEFNRRGFGQ